MRKHYELLPVEGETYFQIRALMDIPMYDVVKGQLGGFVDSEENIEQGSYSWIDDTCRMKGVVTMKESLLKNGCFIFRQGSIENSTLKNVKTVGKGVFLESDVENISSRGYLSMEFVEFSFKGDSQFEIFGWSQIYDSTIIIEKGYVKNSLDMNQCTVKFNEFRIDSKTLLDGLHTIDLDNSPSLTTDSCGQIDYACEIKTIRNDFPESLTMINSSVTGNARLKGNLTLINSTLSDHSYAELNGTLDAVHLSEMAKLIGDKDVSYVREKTLSGEDFLFLLENEDL